MMSPAPTLHQAGERHVLAALAARFAQHAGVEVGPGDDAAVLQTPDRRVVASTDLLVEDRHFRRAWSTPYDIGRRAAAQNFADLAAMGAVPTALLVGLAAPADLPLADALSLADGLADECVLLGASVIGGDLVQAPQLTVAVTALGDLQGRAPLLRSGARPGDRVVLCGRLGWSAAGFALLDAGMDGPPEVLAAFRVPAPPYAAGPRIAGAGASAMCDVSDGLLRDLGDIAASSGVRIEVEVDRVPVDPPVAAAAQLLATDPHLWLLGGGEDHALVATLPPDGTLPGDWIAIGTVTDGEGVGADGYESSTAGWESFSG